MHRLNFQRLFETLPSPHMILDRELRFVAVNAAYERVTMRNRDELIGGRLFELFPNAGESGRRLRGSFDRVFETGQQDTLAYLAYDIPRPEALGGGLDQRFWSAVHVPVLDDEGEVAFIMQNTVDVTEFVRLRQAASLPFRSRPAETALIERAREAEEAHRAALADSEDFRRLFMQAPSFIAIMTGPDHVFTFVNDAYSRLIGDRDVVGWPVREALPEIEGQGLFEMLDAVYSDGTQRGGEGARVMVRQGLETEPRETFLDFSYAAIRDSSGAITGIFVQGMDRTETFRAQRRQRLLLDELNHRVKNTLATVQSIAAQTFRRIDDPVAARAAFEARIVALSRTHNLLSERQWENAELATLVRQELAAFEGSQLAIKGAPVVVNAKAAIALSMVLHELAANAATHGGLSVPDGALAVGWTTEEIAEGGEWLDLRWTERGGTREAIGAKGLGSRIVDRAVRGELAGNYSEEYATDGFTCRIRLPMDMIAGAANAFA